MEIAYIGSSGVLSELPLRLLIQQGVSIKAIVMLAATRRQLEAKPVSIADIKLGDDESLASSASLVEIARRYEIPVIELSEPIQQTVTELAALKIDLILMSCFSKRLPAEIFELPALGCYNMHPSILPAYRGPSPIHWQCMHKVSESGVTVHQVNAEFDQGDIALQKTVKLRTCVNKNELGYRLALLGGEAFIELVQQLNDKALELIPQSEDQASYYGFPE